MHWGSIKIPCLRLTQWYLQRRSIKSPKRYFKVYALRVWVFFLIEYGRLYVGKSDCEYEQIIIYFCFIFPQAICNFSFKCIHFSYGASLCAQLLYASRAISPFFVHISLISFCFQRCYFTMIQCMFFLSSTSWRWLGGSKWEAIIWSAAVENGDHDDEGHSLLGFKRGRWKNDPSDSVTKSETTIWYYA